MGFYRHLFEFKNTFFMRSNMQYPSALKIWISAQICDLCHTKFLLFLCSDKFHIISCFVSLFINYIVCSESVDLFILYMTVSQRIKNGNTTHCRQLFKSVFSPKVFQQNYDYSNTLIFQMK